MRKTKDFKTESCKSRFANLPLFWLHLKKLRQLKSDVTKQSFVLLLTVKKVAKVVC